MLFFRDLEFPRVLTIKPAVPDKHMYLTFMFSIFWQFIKQILRP